MIRAGSRAASRAARALAVAVPWWLPPMLLLCAALSGCVLSREPYYLPDAVIAPPALAGEWRLLGKNGEAEKNEHWEFRGNKALAIDERGQWRAFTLTFFSVEGATFADSIADGPGDDITSGEGYRALHLVPYHMLSRVEIEGDRFTMRPLLSREFKAAGGNTVASWMTQTDYETWVYNATPADWAAFLKRHARDEGLFSDESKLVFARQAD